MKNCDCYRPDPIAACISHQESISICGIVSTIDPARDTPRVVGEFVHAFSNDLLGLTGTAEQVDRAAKAFAVYYKKGEAGPGGGYMMDHSRAAFLMGRKGEPIATLPVEQSGEAVAAELAKWVS